VDHQDGSRSAGGLYVLMFLELCLRLGREAGSLPAVEPWRRDSGSSTVCPLCAGTLSS